MKTQLFGPIFLLGLGLVQFAIGVITSLGMTTLQRWFLADTLLMFVFCFVLASVNKRLLPLDTNSDFAMGYGKLAIGSCIAFMITAVVVTGAAYFANGNSRTTQVSFVYCALAFAVAFFGMLQYEKAFETAIDQMYPDESEGNQNSRDRRG